MIVKKLLVIHPFLFAISPILFLFAYNIDEVPAIDLLVPMLVAVVSTLILLLSIRLITKNYDKIAIVTSFFLILFFSYGHIRQLILSYGIDPHISVNLFLLPIWAVLFVTGAFLIMKSRRDFSISTKFFNVVAITLIVISIVNISIYQIKTNDLTPKKMTEEDGSLNIEISDNLPDVYYIILDQYARSDTLKEFWDYDNSEFTDYLTSKGFYVATRSRSNYYLTWYSLASSLNMEYINYLGDRVTPKDWSVLNKMISNNEVSQFLKSRGYHYIFLRSIEFWKDADQYAEVLEYKGAFGFKLSNFARSLIGTTALEPVEFLLGGALTKSILYVFDTSADIPTIKGPKFVFVYVMAPHSPFVFDRNGNPVKQPIFRTEDPEDRAVRRHQAYLEQLIFINKKVQTLVDELLSKSDVPPIIILQSDTGPTKYIPKPESELTDKNIMPERMNILNAYYFPKKNYELLYESITPVNSFRIVLNLYYDGNYELLNDESYWGTLSKLTILPSESNFD